MLGPTAVWDVPLVGKFTEPVGEEDNNFTEEGIGIPTRKGEDKLRDNHLCSCVIIEFLKV